MTERCEPDRGDQSASRLTGLVRAVDQFQQGHRPLAFLVAVVKKFGDDRCGNLGALLAYYGFVSLFPLLLLLITVLGLVAGGNASLTHSIERSALLSSRSWATNWELPSTSSTDGVLSAWR
jgi:hypothetical protein